MDYGCQAHLPGYSPYFLIPTSYQLAFMSPFIKDILLIDFEGTWSDDPFTSQPTQLGAVLLDKETLNEKDFFVSDIWADLSAVDRALLKRSGVFVGRVERAPKPDAVIKKFIEQFGFDVLLASWVEHLDRRLLHAMLRSSGFPTLSYDYHYLDLWPIAYAYLLKQGYAGGIRSEEMFQALGQNPREDVHDALDDCRREAELLRTIMGVQRL